MYELFDHTADLGLHVRSPTLEQLFQDAALGLRAMIVSPQQTLATSAERAVRCDNPSGRLDDLLFDWLSEILFLFEVEHFLFSEITLSLDTENPERRPTGLSGALRGQIVDPSQVRLEHEVKAITYHELDVHFGVPDTAQGGLEPVWQATIIVDI